MLLVALCCFGELLDDIVFSACVLARATTMPAVLCPPRVPVFCEIAASEEASCERRFVDAWFVIVELRLKPARSHEGCHAFAKVIMCAAFTHKMRDGIYEFLPSGIY